MNDEPQDKVRWVTSASSDEELVRRYDQWARHYEQDVSQDFGYSAPRRACDVVVRYVQKDARILDAGAGTGLVGQCLSHAGYDDIAGIDLSEGMLAEARKKGVYGELRRMRLGRRLDFDDDTFDAVVSVGVLAIGHAPAGSLDELVRITRAGGHVIFTLRPEVYEGLGFKERQADLVLEGRWSLIEAGEPFQAMPKGEPDAYHRIWVYRVL